MAFNQLKKWVGTQLWSTFMTEYNENIDELNRVIAELEAGLPTGSSTVSFEQASISIGRHPANTGAFVLDDRIHAHISNLSSGIITNVRGDGGGAVFGIFLSKHSDNMYSGLIVSHSHNKYVGRFGYLNNTFSIAIVKE